MSGAQLRGSRVAAALVLLAFLAPSPSQSPARVKWTTSRVTGSPDPPSPYRLSRTWSHIPLLHPVFLAQDPGADDRWFAAEYEGKIYSFRPADPAGQKHLALDMGRGISAFSFHPRFALNGQIFVFSHLDEKQKPREGQLSRVSRFELDRGSDPPVFRRDSEKIIVEWPANGHNGGEAIIGPDGYLYVSTGDGTGGSDLKSTGQGIDDLLSVMMRLDVERPDPGRNYSIPKDNPFAGVKGAREEIWAYGFRNPWRFSFDPVTGRPWVGDVGQDLWEMIELSGKGFNHGWSVKEGTHPFHPNKPVGPTPIVAPVVEHHHTECRSITGGYVYQGAKFPELRGAYVYGDYEYGKMWAFSYDYRAGKVKWHRELLDSAVRISSFATARDGNFYALDYDRGEVHMLERRPEEERRRKPTFPLKLSETGLFSSVREHRMAPGVLSYSINAPFWSDGAHKERYVALPNDAGIEFTEKGAWQFDDGAVTVKSFALDLEEGNPASKRWIETRIVVKQDNHWVGYTYEWNQQGTDATLVGARGLDRTFTIKDAAAPGGTRRQAWHYPSRNECMFCHSRAAGFVLGLNTHQMNRAGQLAHLERAGYFKPGKTPPKPAAELPAYPDPFDDRNRDLEARVKTYLAVNCAMCHVSDGGGNSRIETAYHTAMKDARLVGETPMHDTFGIAGALIVAPGAPDRSILLARIARRGNGQMPPTSSNRIDEKGRALITAWINSLK